MTLRRDALTYSGIEIAASGTPLLFGDRGVEGLGQPEARTQLTDRIEGGSVGGLSVPGPALINCEAWLNSETNEDGTWDYSPLHDLYEAMNAIANPEDAVPLSWAGLMWGDREMRLMVRPQRCEWITDEDGIHGGAPGLDLQWLAEDGTKLSESAVTLSGGGSAAYHNLTGSNAGTRRTRSGLAWTASITATTDCASPYIKIPDTDQSVSWKGMWLAAGTTVTVDSRRNTWVDGEGRDGWLRSAGSPFLEWPVLAPGSFTVRLGVESGTCTAQLVYRSTW